MAAVMSSRASRPSFATSFRSALANKSTCLNTVLIGGPSGPQTTSPMGLEEAVSYDRLEGVLLRSYCPVQGAHERFSQETRLPCKEVSAQSLAVQCPSGTLLQHQHWAHRRRGRADQGCKLLLWPCFSPEYLSPSIGNEQNLASACFVVT